MNKSAHDPTAYYYAEREPYSPAAATEAHAADDGAKLVDLAVRYLFLLTAGAAIALLAFAAFGLNTPASQARLEALSDAVSWCALAAAAAVLVPGFSYLAIVLSREFEGEAAYWAFQGLRMLSLIVWFSSLALFLLGTKAASVALVSMAAPADQRSWTPTVDAGKAAVVEAAPEQPVPMLTRPLPKASAR